MGKYGWVILNEPMFETRSRTAKFIKGLTDEEIEEFFCLNDPKEWYQSNEQDYEGQFWGYQLEQIFGRDHFKYLWDYEMFDRCYNELHRKTYKQRLARHLIVSADKGWQVAHRNWRRQVHEKCGYVCAECGSNKNLHAHHIKPRAEFPELQFDVENGITLCKACHDKVHGRVK